MKMNKKQPILTSFVIVLPALLGAFFWNALPEQVPTHFGIDGKADATVVSSSPLLLSQFYL